LQTKRHCTANTKLPVQEKSQGYTSGAIVEENIHIRAPTLTFFPLAAAGCLRIAMAWYVN
jgi:hypothetical protein